jgi:hypothetical protein
MKLDVIYTALSPISHNSDETLSTVSPFRRQKVNYNNEIIDIPVLSGNSFRGVWRRIGAKHLIESLNIEKIDAKLYHLLFAGGALTGSTEDEQIQHKRKIRELVPFLSVFGSSMGNFMLSGKLSSGFGYVISEETEQFTNEKSNRSVYEFLSTEFYTRREDFETENDSETADTIQMKYETEVLISGTKIKQTLIFKDFNGLELGCFMNILQIWKNQGAVIGGVNRVGHGRVDFNIDFDKYKEYIEKYENFLADNYDTIKDFLVML